MQSSQEGCSECWCCHHRIYYNTLCYENLLCWRLDKAFVAKYMLACVPVALHGGWPEFRAPLAGLLLNSDVDAPRLVQRHSGLQVEKPVWEIHFDSSSCHIVSCDTWWIPFFNGMVSRCCSATSGIFISRLFRKCMVREKTHFCFCNGKWTRQWTLQALRRHLWVFWSSGWHQFSRWKLNLVKMPTDYNFTIKCSHCRRTKLCD